MQSLEAAEFAQCETTTLTSIVEEITMQAAKRTVSDHLELNAKTLGKLVPHLHVDGCKGAVLYVLRHLGCR